MKKVRNSTFQGELGRIFFLATFGAVLLFSLFDILSSAINLSNLQNHSEEIISQVVIDSLKQPLVQGSFVEAGQRLQQLTDKHHIFCAKLKAWEMYADSCQERPRKMSALTVITSEIKVVDGSDSIGTVSLFFDHSQLRWSIASRIFLTALLFLISWLVVRRLFVRQSQRLQIELNSLVNLVASGAENQDSVSSLAVEIDEFRLVAQELQSLLKIKAERMSKDALLNLAAQVAHDVRSPLAALDSIISQIKTLPEDQRTLVRSAINRIKDIANNLLQKNREMATKAKSGSDAKLPGVIVESSGEPISAILLSSLIDPLITEKRMQFRSKIGIEIDCRLDASSYGLFARIHPTEFKRVLSNLINNAVEVLGEQGSVELTLEGKGEQIEIKVHDNGKGIPPDILSRLGQRGETHGKSGGSGLGLYHARSSVESWDGKLEITSVVGKGTIVIITLPQAKVPEWFVSEIKLTPHSFIVVLDDDSSIHGIWQRVFDALNAQEKGIEIQHFSTPDELIKWVQGSSAARSALYLTDYELLGYKETGLSLIETLKIGSQSILVTSRFEEKSVREGCERLMVRLIPKGMVGFVPVSFAEPLERPDYVLLDNDDLVHMNWKNSAGSRKVLFFIKPTDLFAYASKLHKSSPIYIDSSLDDGIQGEDVAKKLVEKGFEEVWLCTGYPAEKFEHLTYLRGVIGKEPPWIMDKQNFV